MVLVDQQPHDRAEAPLADALFHGLHQIQVFEGLDFHFGVANDIEWMGFEDGHARK